MPTLSMWVYVEKPLVLNESEAVELIDLADRENRVLMVGHLLQSHPVFGRLKELVKCGELGRIDYSYFNRLNLGNIRREENILWPFAPHDISMILALAGEEPGLEPLKREWVHFLESIKEGGSPITDGREGLRVLKVLKAAQDALDNPPTRVFNTAVKGGTRHVPIFLPLKPRLSRMMSKSAPARKAGISRASWAIPASAKTATSAGMGFATDKNRMVLTTKGHEGWNLMSDRNG